MHAMSRIYLEALSGDVVQWRLTFATTYGTGISWSKGVALILDVW